jgi:hypothetical protein
MIVAHVNAQRDRLTHAEVDDILGTRYSEIGRAAYLAGNIREGSRLLAAAIWCGHRPWANLAYLVSASPPVRLAKRLVRHSPVMPEGFRSRSLVL